MPIFPTIVIVPGAWHSPEFFNSVISILEPLGYKCVTISMPGVGGSPPVDSLDEDIAAVRTVVMKELETGNDAIIHAHSWGGIPVNSALDGLSKAERDNDGKKGAVVKLTFVSSFVLPENTSLLDLGEGVAPDFWDIQEDGNLWLKDMKGRLYHDLNPKEQQYWLSTLKPQSIKGSLPTAFPSSSKLPHVQQEIVTSSEIDILSRFTPRLREKKY
ncbi:hypothetical protein D0Z07_2593 [Hyphodiscus hymeniophilus]|uniref:AB hydrolase-1 domain-containing protein n=1 Tax=Hyphodiscus hymeniophilus TaxID=353542 RepID=A0A9P6VML7_9HELO|nr:hypothetical protein D0Z07_2593 [Hyphodiscus hymeniophilus]